MAQQQIITKPYVEELQDNDSLFINHDGALRQIKKSGADFASGADMRAEVAAREAFEAQEVAAREAFEKSETEARGQFETSVGEQIAEKANVDGYYEEMTVGDAEQLVSTQFVEDNEPYLFRPTGGSSDVGNRAYIEAIVGGTVAWNQLVPTREPTTITNNGITFVIGSDGIVTMDGTAIDDVRFVYTNRTDYLKDHVYLVLGVPKGGSETTYRALVTTWNYDDVIRKFTYDDYYGVRIEIYNGTTVSNVKFAVQCFDLTQMFGTTIADYIYSLEQSQAGAGVAWFKKLFPKDYYEYNAGELLSVEGLQSHDMVGFNQWDEETELGTISITTGEPSSSSTQIRSKNFSGCIGGQAYYNSGSMEICVYFYDADKTYIRYRWISSGGIYTFPSNARYFKIALLSDYGTTYNHDICINLSDSSRNGEYEPYEKHSYPLDSSLTLRGIPKLGASNNLYYDGDEYTSDGKVKRKYGVVDLGTLNWQYSKSDGWHQVVFKNRGRNNLLCDRYKTDKYELLNNKTIGCNSSYLVVVDTSYTDGNALKQALQGVMLVYELATPTTETAKPFQYIQIVDDFGTEEFVSTGIVPVGHKTRYPANLRDKLQHLPSLASADGTYLIQQSGKQMSLIHMPAVFPDIPTEDGTYTLKTVVTGGVATLQWVAE